MPEQASARDLVVARIVAATELTKLTNVKVTGEPEAVAKAYTLIFKAIIEAGV
jgi:hypothetical protein